MLFFCWAMRVMGSHSAENYAIIKSLYHEYRHTTDLDEKGFFFSLTCLQICRPTPAYAATTRAQIVQYLRDAQQGKIPLDNTAIKTPKKSEVASHPTESASDIRSVYTIRPLNAAEFEFGTEAVTAPVGVTPGELKEKAEQEHWIGMRVDLWDEGGAGTLLVKVQYWWRLEAASNEERKLGVDQNRVWKQCLHDIMFLGPKDGTEGQDGLEILE